MYGFVALHREASPLIRRYGLKQVPESGPFPRFADPNGTFLLTLTGVGNAAAAAAVSATFTQYPPAPEDLLLSLGTAAGEPTGEICLCNKLTEASSDRTFYPDVVWEHPFTEAACVTENHVVTDRELSGDLFDMEAASVYQAANYYVGPHQMLFLKVISDPGDGTRLTPAGLTQRMEDAMSLIGPFVDRLWAETRTKKAAVLSDPQLELLERAVQDLHCSSTMEHSFRQCVRYAALSGQDWESGLRLYYEEGRLPAPDRQRGKRVLQELEACWSGEPDPKGAP